MGNKRRVIETAGVRELIMQAARELFVQQGYDAVTMRQIAKAIDYAPGAIYFHFRDKETLIREMCKQDLMAVTAAIRQEAKTGTPVTQLKSFLMGYAVWGLKNPKHYELMLLRTCPASDYIDDELQQKKGNPEHDAYALLVQTVQAVIDARLLKPRFKDAQLVSQVVWGAVHGVVALAITHRNDPWFDWRPVEERLELVLDSVIGGMLRTNSEADSPTAAKNSGRTRKAVRA